MRSFVVVTKQIAVTGLMGSGTVSKMYGDFLMVVTVECSQSPSVAGVLLNTAASTAKRCWRCGPPTGTYSCCLPHGRWCHGPQSQGLHAVAVRQ